MSLFLSIFILSFYSGVWNTLLSISPCDLTAFCIMIKQRTNMTSEVIFVGHVFIQKSIFLRFISFLFKIWSYQIFVWFMNANITKIQFFDNMNFDLMFLWTTFYVVFIQDLIFFLLLLGKLKLSLLKLETIPGKIF